MVVGFVASLGLGVCELRLLVVFVLFDCGVCWLVC